MDTAGRDTGKMKGSMTVKRIRRELKTGLFKQLAVDIDFATAQFTTVRSVYTSSDGSIAGIVGDQRGLLICTKTEIWTFTSKYDALKCSSKSSAKYSSVAFDSTGTNIIAALEVGYYLSYGRVSDAVTTWTSTAKLAGPKGVAASWSSCVASDSFSVLVCAQCGGYTYASKDSGKTWTGSSSTSFFTTLAITSSGNSIIAGSSYSAPYLALSNDGLTWQEQKGCQASLPTNAVAITSTNYYSARSVSITKHWRWQKWGGMWGRGMYIYEFCYTRNATVNGKTVYSGYQGTQSLYKSSTAKFTAENDGESDNDDTITESDDDDTITVASSNSSFTIDTSTEFVWSEYSNSKSASYSNSAVSSDGTVIVGAIGDGGLEISVDSGDTWTTSTAAGKHVDWSDVITSSDGSYIFAVTYGGSVYASNDYGVTLTEASVPVEDDFISVKCSR